MKRASLVQFVSRDYSHLDTTADGSRVAVPGVVVRDQTTERLITTSSEGSVEFVVCCHGRAVQSRLVDDAVHSWLLNASTAKITETTELASGGDSLRSSNDGCIS